ncbi:ABC transporter permease [Microbacterium thalassium]|uniref:Iron(III) transport system permease protein n=1 Tax=Microbacterium thalassium TaxID=362649 RepID=A0A7X0FQ11_9MICO|nr:iron ABC transporter permease [Microbacterium thalassium]MBB6391553.1 iron(III) transport system permease protein [Microbacterium thalassium]
MPSSRRPPRTLWVAALVACALASVPLVYLIARVAGAGPEQIAEALSRPRVPELIGTSLLLSASVTVATIAIGVPSAFLLARAALPARGLWAALAALPLAVPSYLAAYGWLAAVPGMQGFWAAWFVLTSVCLPYVTLPTAAALRLSTTGFDDLARTLGRGPVAAFFSGTWPQIAPAVSAGALLAFLYTLSDFGGVALFRLPVLTTAVHQAFGASFDRDYALILAGVLVVIALAVVLAEQVLRRRAPARAPHGPRAARFRLGAALPAALILLATPSLLAAGVPTAILVARALDAAALRAFDLAEFAEALAGTLAFAVGGAVIAIVLALPIGALAARYRGRRVRIVETAAVIPLGLPGIVVGLSLVAFSLTVVPWWYQTALILAFAYGVMFLPKAVGGVRSSIGLVPPALEDVSRTLGRTGLQTWWQVTARLARPGILAAALLVAVTAMKELPATLLLRPTGTDTLATELWSRTDVAAYGAAAPYALALLVVATIPAFLLSRHRDPEDV